MLQIASASLFAAASRRACAASSGVAKLFGSAAMAGANVRQRAIAKSIRVNKARAPVIPVENVTCMTDISLTLQANTYRRPPPLDDREDLMLLPPRLLCFAVLEPLP